MPIDFDPVFHTETMVKILREQGSTQYATELAELILQKNPDHQGVRQILEELREDARRAFERFKSGGRSTAATDEAELDSEGEPQEPAAEEEFSTAAAETCETEIVCEVSESIEPQSDAAAEIPEFELSSTEEALAETIGTEQEPVAEEGAKLVLVPSPVEAARLTLVPAPPPPSCREKKIYRLQSLLRRIQSLRRDAHAPEA